MAIANHYNTRSILRLNYRAAYLFVAPQRNGNYALPQENSHPAPIISSRYMEGVL